jgi:hypothetical protein
MMTALFAGRLQARRPQPLAHVGGNLSLSGPPKHQFTRKATKLLCGLPKARTFFHQSFFEGLGVLETPPRDDHGAAPFHSRKAGAQPAFSSPMGAEGCAVMLN